MAGGVTATREADWAWSWVVDGLWTKTMEMMLMQRLRLWWGEQMLMKKLRRKWMTRARDEDQPE